MKNIVNHYKTLLCGEKFYVTGSLALSYLGFCEEKDVHDIDIIVVNPTDECRNILNRLVEDNSAKTKPYPGSNLAGIFMHDNVKVDVFFLSKAEKTIPSGDGFDVSTIDGIVRAKKNINRLKDWKQLLLLSEKICSEREFLEKIRNAK